MWQRGNLLPRRLPSFAPNSRKTVAILTSIDGTHDNVLVVEPPWISKADADELLHCFERVVLEDLVQLDDVIAAEKTPT
jgi:hypothetical protein